MAWSATSVPVSGSAYSYTYATMGEFVAYIVGWCLFLDNGVASSAIAVGLGQYLNELLLDTVGARMPNAIANPPGIDGGVFNLPAVVLILLACLLMMKGTKETARVNAIMVATKIAILIMFIAIGLTAFHASHLHPFMPMGIHGIGAAASSIFFSYLGMDVISTTSEEAQNPKRNLPLAIIWTVVIVSILYVLVALISVSAQPYTEFNDREASMAAILRKITNATWPSVILSLGAIVSIFSCLLATLFSQTRILLVMARDGLIPKLFAQINRNTQTPLQNTGIVAALVAIAAASFPLDVLADLTSMGTLVAFFMVSVGVMILRQRRPELSQGGFRVPFYPLVPLLSAASCLYLIAGLSENTFWLFGIWITIAVIIYFSFSIRNSGLSLKARFAE